MASNIGGFAVLPQFQGNLYDLQRQQMLAQALMQNATTPIAQPQTVGSGGSQNYQVMPKMSPIAALAPLAQGLLSAKIAQNVGKGLGALGAQQWQAFGGGAPATDTSQAALVQGAVNGSVGPTNTNAALMNSAAAPQQTTMIGGGNATPMNPLGINPALAYTGFTSDPGKYFETQAALYKPTEATLMARQAGMTPDQQQAANAQALLKANSLEIRPGGGYMNNGVITTMPAAAPNGFQNVQDPVSKQWYTVPVQGGTAALTASNAAGAIGRAYGDVTPGFQNGQPVFINRGALAAGTAGGTGAPGGTNAGPFAGYQAPGSALPMPSLPPGASSLAEGAADRIKALSTQAASTPNAIDGFNKAEAALLSGVQTGPGSTMGTNILGRLNTAGIPIAQGDTTGYQSLQKFLSNANAQAAAAGGYNGSDARFEAFAHGQPNTETMNPQALRYAIQYVRGQQAGVAAKNQATTAYLAQNGGSTVNYPQFEAKWNQVYNPDVMMVRAMPNPADQQAYLSQLKQQGKLGAWMNSYKQMQGMGAW